MKKWLKKQYGKLRPVDGVQRGLDQLEAAIIELDRKIFILGQQQRQPKWGTPPPELSAQEARANPPKNGD